MLQNVFKFFSCNKLIINFLQVEIVAKNLQNHAYGIIRRGKGAYVSLFCTYQHFEDNDGLENVSDYKMIPIGNILSAVPEMSTVSFHAPTEYELCSIF